MRLEDTHPTDTELDRLSVVGETRISAVQIHSGAVKRNLVLRSRHAVSIRATG